MYPVPEALKTIYKNDFIPAVPVNYAKYLILYFPELDLTIDTRTTGRIDGDSFSLDESLCSASDLTLGACEASVLKIKINGIVQDLTGKKCIVTQHVDNTYEMPFGEFTVKTAGKQSDLGFKELTMFDSMIKTDVDVTGWYNALTWPQTVKSMRQSLLTYLGLQYEDQTITNDTVQVPKTINPSTLIGRDVLRRLCEINVGFGHFTRNGKFKVIQLSGIGLYPSETLYPAEDLFPSESGEYISAGYENADYEEYIVESITSVTIREDDEDVGATSGVPGNPYIITGNFLLYGKSASELQAITDNMLLQIKNKFYRPHNTRMIGLPYMEVGDSVTIITSTDAIESFIFKRTLTGINALKDEISASGNQKRDQKVSPSTQIQQLKGKTLRIQKSVDELRVDMTDADAQLATQISVTAGGLQTQITDNKNNANSQFSQQAAEIALRVEKSGVVAAINLTPESVKIAANKVELSGYATFTSLSTPGQTVIDGANLKTGTVTADVVRSSWVYAGNISASQITAGTMSADRISGGTLTSTSTANGTTTIVGGQIKSEGSSYTTSIYNGQINTSYINITQGGGSSVSINGNTVLMTNSDLSIYGGDAYVSGNLTCNTLNGSTPILTSNRSQYLTLLYDSNGNGAQVTSTGNNFRPHSNYGSGIVSCGSPSYLWSQVFASSTTISSSDGNLKAVLGDTTDSEKKVAIKIKSLITKFKFKDAIAKKGNGARVHFGIIAQDVKSAFESEGLDPYSYAMFCSDTWYEKNGSAVDENENMYTNDEEGVTEVTQLGIRYEELLCFIIGCM